MFNAYFVSCILFHMDRINLEKLYQNVSSKIIGLGFKSTYQQNFIMKNLLLRQKGRKERPGKVH